MTIILSNLNENSQDYIKCAGWMVSNIVKNRHPPDQIYLIQAASFAFAHLNLGSDFEIQRDLLYTLDKITENSLEGIELNQAVCELLVTFLSHSSSQISLSALRTIGNIIFSTNGYTSVFIECGLLGKMFGLLDYRKSVICKEALLVLSNMCVENNDTVQRLIFFRIFPIVVRRAMGYDLSIRKEAIYVLASICDNCPLDIKPKLLRMRIAEPLTEGLLTKDSEIREMCIKALIGVLKDIKEAMSVGEILKLVDVRDIVGNCKELARQGTSAAQGLMRDIAWLTRFRQ